MNSGLYAAYGGLLARTQALDVAANNLANVGTTGFRAGRETFRGMLAAQSGSALSQVGDAVNGFALLGSAGLSDAQGQLTSTGNPLDLAIQGTGFFTVKTAAGIRYTRDGSFQVSSAGVLQTKSGAAVLDSAGNSITVPSGDVKVGADGSVSVATAQGSVVVGRVAIADLGTGGAEAAEGDNLYKAAPGAQVTAAAGATVQQGALEGSNEDAVHGTMQLMLMQRQAEMMQRALSVFHNDMDKTAAEELSKV